MRAKMVMAGLLAVASGGAGAQATLDAQTLELVIPSVSFGGNAYAVRMSYTGGCFVPTQIQAATSGTRATLGHFGFDFSTGNGQPDWEQTDGYVTAWASFAYPPGYAYGSAVWYTPYEYPNATNGIYIQDMGAVSFDSVTSVPTDWSYSEGMVDYPLTAGHVYVVRARDGYAKFEVLSVTDMTGVDTSTFDFSTLSAEINYAYTSGTTF